MGAKPLLRYIITIDFFAHITEYDIQGILLKNWYWVHLKNGHMRFRQGFDTIVFPLDGSNYLVSFIVDCKTFNFLFKPRFH